MGLDNITLYLNPSLQDLKEIEYFLLSEYQKTEDGFHKNIDLVRHSSKNGNLKVFKEQNMVIAFAIDNKLNLKTVELSIFCVRHNNRTKGFGRKCLKLLEEFYWNENITAIQVDSFENTLSFWEKNEFLPIDEENNMLFRKNINNYVKTKPG